MNKEQEKKLNDIVKLTIRIINEKRAQDGLMPLNYQLVVFPSVVSMTGLPLFGGGTATMEITPPISEQEIKEFHDGMKDVNNFNCLKNETKKKQE